MKFLLNKNTKLILIVSVFTVMIVSVFFSLSEPKAQASTADNVSGYAWSGNIGWISLNCTNTSCTSPATNYGLNIDASGNVYGYAWSSNIGWIKFGGLASFGFPSGPGTSSTEAKVNGNNITGWVRACGGLNTVTTPQINQTTPNSSCYGVSRTDGWDGWISLSGTGYGLNINSINTTTSSITGYAWGSDVVGWIQFNGVTSVIPVPGGTLALTANGSSSPITVNSGSTVTLSSSGTLLDTTVNGTANSTADGVASTDWTGSKTCPGSSAVTYTPNLVLNNTGSAVKTFTFTLQCTVLTANGGGFVNSNTVTVNVNPPPTAVASLSLIANSSTTSANTITVNSGETFSLSASGNLLDGTDGTASATPSNSSWTGSNKSCPSSTPISYTPSFSFINPSTTTNAVYKFNLTCTSTTSTGKRGFSDVYYLIGSATVNVRPSAPASVALKDFYDPSFTNQILSPLPINGGDVYLQWTSSNVTNGCTASNLPSGTSYSGWTGANKTANILDSQSIHIVESTTFKLTCVSGVNSVSSSAYIGVGSVPPPGCPAAGTTLCPKKQPHYIEQ